MHARKATQPSRLSDSLTGLLSAILLLLSSSSNALASDAGLPRMVAFFPVKSQVCPAGWNEYERAKGFVIRGTQFNSQIGQQIGRPMRDSTTPLHQHFVDFSFPLKQTSKRPFGGQYPRVTNSAVRAVGWIGAAELGMPFVQYLVCQEPVYKDRYDALSYLLPEQSVQWFSGDACPMGWEPYYPLSEGRGRTALPLPSDAAASDVGAIVDSPNNSFDHPHEHDIHVENPDKPESVKLLLSGTNDKFAWNMFKGQSFAIRDIDAKTYRTGKVARVDLGDPALETQNLVPYVYLRPCRKTADSVNIRSLPAGLGTFFSGLNCPTGLNEVIGADGHFPIGLPHGENGSKPVSGQSFGGPNGGLRSREIPSHRHFIDLAAGTNHWEIDPFFAGNEHLNGLQKTPGRFTGHTEPDPVVFPYVQLNFCRVPG